MPVHDHETTSTYTDKTSEHTVPTTAEDLNRATDIVDKLNRELRSGAIMNTPEFRQAFSDLTHAVCEAYVRLDGEEPQNPMIIEERDLY